VLYLYTEDLLNPSSKSLKKSSSCKSVAANSAKMHSILSFMKGFSLTGLVLSLSSEVPRPQGGAS